MDLQLINENQIGVAKDTEALAAVEGEFKGETYEVGVYLAMARQAEREGLPEVARVLEKIALEEAWHAARFAELAGKISSSTKENIEKMLKGEMEANKGKKEAAKKAKELGLDEVHDALDESSRDEARHARALKGLLDRYFK
ncbi:MULTISPECIES: ferritin-like domain-containing protein [Carboxydothermus]|uniref:Rubrerythrin n=2 Tax=Carboxydothermus TaxID=129957 RepID=Q3AEK8_CARHZ|nr:MULTISPECIES: ferritin family protein [Carboxydothermus]ABB14527.1 rubrerythrin [Carboxydothermus hydrogenoformans Z-2901]NYE56448.1 rubrerythrin [Carboxydothermus ferrireducens DSM 11255]